MSTTDERIAALERQVEALTEQLAARDLERSSSAVLPDDETKTPSRRRFLRYAAAGAGATAGAVLAGAEPASANDPNDITLSSYKATSGGPTIVGNTGTAQDNQDWAQFVLRSGTGGLAELPELPSAALGAWATANGASAHGLHAYSARGSAVRAVSSHSFDTVVVENHSSGGAISAVASRGPGVYAESDRTAGWFQGGRAALYLASDPFDPSNLHAQGELHSSAGTLQACVGGGVPGTWRVLASPDAAGALHPLTVPARVYDSRAPAPAPGKLTAGQNRTLDVFSRRDLTTGAVTEANIVPAGATAIVFNLTITETEGFGYLAVNPGGQTTVTASTINWTQAAETMANGGTARVNADRKVTVVAGGGAGSRTHFVLDVVGYYS